MYSAICFPNINTQTTTMQLFSVIYQNNTLYVLNIRSNNMIKPSTGFFFHAVRKAYLASKIDMVVLIYRVFDK